VQYADTTANRLELSDPVSQRGPAPFFTVVVPTYRRPEMLGEAVASILAQTFDDFELIVVDDDPAGSAELALANLADPRLEYVRNDRGRGGAGTRNAGIFRARGAWVAFLDDDDVWLPDKLARQHRKIVESGPDLGMVYTGYAVYDFERRRVIAERRCRSEGTSARKLLYRNYIGGLFSVAIRTDVLKAIGGLDERFPALQDLELFVRVASNAEVAFVDETLVLARKDHEERITRNASGKLRGSQLFWSKFRSEISRDPRLMHRAASRVFTFALAARDFPALLGSLPWMLAGVLFAPGNVLGVARKVAGRLVYGAARSTPARHGGGGAE
jgi:glycosyltransferase involved in cell wall biosynthesis